MSQVLQERRGGGVNSFGLPSLSNFQGTELQEWALGACFLALGLRQRNIAPWAVGADGGVALGCGLQAEPSTIY